MKGKKYRKEKRKKEKEKKESMDMYCDPAA